jgi:hypothetical protein
VLHFFFRAQRLAPDPITLVIFSVRQLGMTVPLLALALGLGLGVPGAGSAQDAAPPNESTAAVSREDAPRVYIDCDRCDMSHVRTVITFVNHVRDPDVAQVYVMVTDQRTGAGGRRYTLSYRGQGEFAGVENTLSYSSVQSNTSAQERAGLTRMLELGLVPYVARTSLASRIDLSYRAPGEAAGRPVSDRWSNWTFEVYGGGNLSMESTQSAWNARYGFYANRVTEDWKIRLRPYFNHNARVIRRTDREDINIDQRRHGFESYVIRSLGDHWGAGVFGSYLTSTIDNMAHGVDLAPAVEYSFFPYDQASTRQITVSYRVGYQRADYLEETIYEKTEEDLVSQSLEGAVRIRQQWGSIFAGLTGSNYLHDLDHHRLTVDSNVSFRLGRGISLNVGGTYQRINDQLALPRRDASLEDILLQRRRLATSYRGAFNVGLSYTFGSIYTNVVNPRL